MNLKLVETLVRRRGQDRKGLRFYDDPDPMIWVQPAPWSRSSVLR